MSAFESKADIALQCERLLLTQSGLNATGEIFCSYGDEFNAYERNQS